MNTLAIYLHLAQAAKMRRRPQSQVRLLLMAAIAAHQLKMPRIANACRYLMLKENPHHMVRRWETISLALDDPDFRHFLHQVERRYPPERAEQMMATLEIELGNEREVYASDEEYAAALLGLRVEDLDGLD